MRLAQHLKILLPILLLVFTVSGAVNAKVVSGSQHLTLLGSDTPAGGLVGEDLESAITAGIRVERFNRQLHTVEVQWIENNAKAFAKALKEGEEPTAEDIALAEERLSQQAFRQVQFGVEGEWDQEAHVYLRRGTGRYLDKDPGLSDLGPAVSFYADPYQKAAIHMFADHVAPNVAFHQRNGIEQPSFEQILTAAERDGEQRGRHLKQFLVGAAVTGTLVLAPVVAGSSIAAAVAAFAKDPVGYCLVNPAACTVAAETVACTVVEGCPINSVVHASKSATAKSIAKATGNNNLDNVAKILAEAGKRRGDDVVNKSGSIRNVNPTRGTQNCVNCSIATDATLAGRPASALPGNPTSISVLEKQFGGAFISVSGQSQISTIMSNAGSGARGIVFGQSKIPGQPGHVFNVVNQKGTIRFLDGQSGEPATFNGLKNFQFLRTN